MLGAFAPLNVRLQSSTSDVLAQLVSALPGLRSRTVTAEAEPNFVTIPSLSAPHRDSMI